MRNYVDFFSTLAKKLFQYGFPVSTKTQSRATKLENMIKLKNRASKTVFWSIFSKNIILSLKPCIELAAAS